MLNNMENNLKVFESALFGQVRSVVDESNEPWFAAMDVCKCLDLKNTSVALSRLDEDEVTKLNLGGLQGETNFVNEFGLYSLVLSSRKPEAKNFKRWITHEVIPSIRKDGGYLVTKQGESDDEVIARAMGLLHKKLEESKQFIARQELEIEKHQELMKSIAPKADYYDQVLTAESTYTTTQIAKEFGMSGKRLNEVLHAMGVQYKVYEQWVLYADYCGKGYTKTLTFTYSDADGQLHSRQSTAWTEKGREFIHKLMKENKK